MQLIVRLFCDEEVGEVQITKFFWSMHDLRWWVLFSLWNSNPRKWQ